MEIEVDEKGFVRVDGDFWVQEKCVCHHCLDQRLAAGKLPLENEERFSFGHYAGRYCKACWKNSGYRDASDPGAEFDPDDAGESLEGDGDGV